MHRPGRPVRAACSIAFADSANDVVLSPAFPGVLPCRLSVQAKCNAHDSQLRYVLCDIYIVISNVTKQWNSCAHGFGEGRSVFSDLGDWGKFAAWTSPLLSVRIPFCRWLPHKPQSFTSETVGCISTAFWNSVEGRAGRPPLRMPADDL